MLENSMVGLKTAKSSIKYVQRRKYYRMDCLLPLQFSLIEANGSFPEIMSDGQIRELSGGGMRIAAEFEMAEEDLIKFTFQLDNEFFELIGGIRHKTYVPDLYLSYLYGVMFMSLSVRKREEIASYLHRCQLVSLQYLSRASIGN